MSRLSKESQKTSRASAASTATSETASAAASRALLFFSLAQKVIRRPPSERAPAEPAARIKRTAAAAQPPPPFQPPSWASCARHRTQKIAISSLKVVTGAAGDTAAGRRGHRRDHRDPLSIAEDASRRLPEPSNEPVKLGRDRIGLFR